MTEHAHMHHKGDFGVESSILEVFGEVEAELSPLIFS